MSHGEGFLDGGSIQYLEVVVVVFCGGSGGAASSQR